MVLITFVQGIVSSLDKHFAPLIKAGGQKPRKHADEHFLDKRRVHAALGSNRNAITAGLPESPLGSFHDPEPEKQIRNSVRQNT